MNQHNNNQFETAIVHWHLSRAICHMSDQTGLDGKSLMMTIHLKSAYDVGGVAQNIYGEICKHLNLGRIGPIPPHRMPALIWSIDAAGSRQGKMSDLTTIPHMHAIVIMPRMVDCFGLNLPVVSLTKKIEVIPGVSKFGGKSKAVLISQFSLRTDPKNAVSAWKQYFDFVSYSIKAETILSQSHSISANGPTSGVLPYDDLTDDVRRSLESSKVKVEENLNRPDRRFKHFSRPNT